MNDTFLTVTLVLIFIVGPFWLIYKMDKRAAKKGALFTGPATREMRTLAIVLGVVFAGLFMMEITSSESIHLLFPILALALIGYGLGAGQQLRKLQSRESRHLSTEPTVDSMEQNEIKLFSKNRLVRFGATLTIVVVISLILLFGAVWVANHPDDPFSWIFVIGIIIFVVLGSALDWFKFLRSLFK